METTENVNEKSASLYEIGYLLNPFISTENVANEVNKAFCAPIEAQNGEITSQLMPFMRPLAYAVSKSIGSKRDTYKDAYFGALRFEITPDKILAVKELLDKNEMVLRYILLRLPKNAERVINFSYRKPVSRHEANIGHHATKETEGAEDKVEKIDEEQIDKKIEDLLVENVA